MQRTRFIRPGRALEARSRRATRHRLEGPLRPSRPRLDPDRIVGYACALLVPVALWLAGG